MRDFTNTLLSLDIDSRRSSPLQQQLRTQLRAIILAGKLHEGARLPATRAFAQQVGVSRNTVTAAYDHLIAEGYLEARRGAGVFVVADLPESFTQTPEAGARKATEKASEPLKEKQPTESMPTGLPAIDLFPKDIWARLTSSAWRRADTNLLEHADTLGYAPLRHAIADYLASSRNIRAVSEQIMIVSGLQQGLKLIADSLLKKDSPIILEDPGYGGLLVTAATCNQPTVFTKIDHHGALVPALHHKNSLLIVCPSHQYPLGMTMPVTRRLELIEWARATNSLILEDDYDSEFRYAGRPLNSLQGIEGGERIIYGGTFSKSVFPALRLGYLVLPEPMVDTVRHHRSTVESYPSIVPQLVLSEFMNGGHFSRHIRRLRKIHSERQAHYAAEFTSKLAGYFDLQAADAGLHLVAYGTNALKNSALCDDISWAQITNKSGLSARPLSASYRRERAKQGLLLGFANFQPKEITRSVEKLARYMLEETGF